MSTNLNRPSRLQILDRCFSDFNSEYSCKQLIELCHTSRATFHRDLAYIRDCYGKEIFDVRYLRRGVYRYSVPGFSISDDVLDDKQLAQIKSVLLLLSKFVGKPQFDYLQSVVQHLEKKYEVEVPMSDAVIHFDGNPYVKGLEYLVPLFEAIVHQQCKQISYQPFTGKKSVYIVHPYLLKEYNQRWYLLCNKQSDIDEKPALVTLSLDRIENISDIQYAFCPAPEGIQEYFDDFIGITNKHNHEVIDVVIKCKPKEFKFLMTRPLHPTQRALSGKPNHIQISVKENYELYQWLLFYGDQIEVVSPNSVRNELKRVMERMLVQYSTQ